MNCLFWFCCDRERLLGRCRNRCEPAPQQVAFGDAKPQKCFHKQQMHQLWALLFWLASAKGNPLGRAHLCTALRAIAQILRLQHRTIDLSVRVTTTVKPLVTAASRNNSKQNCTASSVGTKSLTKKMKQTDLSTHSYKGIDMPFSLTKAAAIQAQTLQAIISGNTPLQFFEDIEVLKLMWMLRTAAPGIMPSANFKQGCWKHWDKDQ